MATSSFTKKMVINDPESLELFMNVISTNKDNPNRRPINRDLASYEAMERGRQLLKQRLSR